MKTALLRRTAGLTLVELMVGLAVLGILLSLAVPSFRDLLSAQRGRSAAYSLVSDLVLARSEAVKRGSPVVLTAAAAGWAGGWTITVQATSELLARQKDLGPGVTVSASPATATTVVFDRNGRLSPATPLRFELTDTSERKRCIWLDPSGRPKNAQTGCPA